MRIARLRRENNQINEKCGSNGSRDREGLVSCARALSFESEMISNEDISLSNVRYPRRPEISSVIPEQRLLLADLD